MRSGRLVNEVVRSNAAHTRVLLRHIINLPESRHTLHTNTASSLSWAEAEFELPLLLLLLLIESKELGTTVPFRGMFSIGC